METDRLLLRLSGEGSSEGLKAVLDPVDRAASVNQIGCSGPSFRLPASVHLPTSFLLVPGHPPPRGGSFPPSTKLSLLLSCISYAWVWLWIQTGSRQHLPGMGELQLGLQL